MFVQRSEFNSAERTALDENDLLLLLYLAVARLLLPTSNLLLPSTVYIVIMSCSPDQRFPCFRLSGLGPASVRALFRSYLINRLTFCRQTWHGGA